MAVFFYCLLLTGSANQPIRPTSPKRDTPSGPDPRQAFAVAASVAAAADFISGAGPRGAQATMPIKKSTHFAGGIAAGGTPEAGGWRRTNQITLLTLRASQSAVTATLPAKTVILRNYAYPDPEAPAATGSPTVTLANTTDAVTYINAGDAKAYTAADVTEVTLTTDCTITVTPASMTAGEFVIAGFEVILPETRN